MHKTKTGRWQPDKLPAPEPAKQPDKLPAPEPAKQPDLSFEAFLFHKYTHDLRRAGCEFCYPVPDPMPPPWGVLKSLRLTTLLPPGKRRAGGS